MISMRLAGCATGVRVPDVLGAPMTIVPYRASDLWRISTVCGPLGRVPVEMLVPVTLLMIMGVPLSMMICRLLVPVSLVMGTEAEVPVKAKAMPEPG